MTKNTVRLLLIEDDEDDYILVSELLREVKETHYEINWISRYADGLAALLSDSYDVCLVDYRLGEGTGIELLRDAVLAKSHLPVILLTGQGGKEIDIEATEAGASDYLVKSQIDALLLERTIRYTIARGKMLETLRESEIRFRSVIESAHDAIILTDRHGEIISWNNAARVIFGYTEDEILGRSLSMLFPAGYSHNFSAESGDPMLTSGLLHRDSKASELYGVRKEGEAFPLEISFSSWETSEGIFYSGIIRDITERKSLEDQLTHQALHDPLTGLANRVLFRDRVEHAFERFGRSRQPVAVLFLDLDNFKDINDSLGHAAGDAVLISVAKRLELCLRTSDTAARLGGDEFAVLVEDMLGADGSLLVAERIRDILRPPFSIEGKEVNIGASIGIATTDKGSRNPEELLRDADVAMYMAKSQGKDRIAVFESEMHEVLVRRIELEADMRRAIDAEEFALHYQPIVDLQTGRLIGVEALARWDHPLRGPIPPMEFIRIAEETNLIFPLGQWILEEACRQVRSWQVRYNCESMLSVSVNISSRQFQESTLANIVAGAIAKSGLDPGSLILEITENTMLQSTSAAVEKLHDLRDLGVRLAIDDFGTGYSSLSYLQRFPIDILKIDRSFIEKIDQSPEGAAVAQAIITLSDTLRLKTIAEGIETPEQIAALQRLGCKLGQGFHFAKPLDPIDMGDFLRLAKLEKEPLWNSPHLAPHGAENGTPGSRSLKILGR